MKGELENDRVVIWGDDGRNLFHQNWFGELQKDRLELSLVEAASLLEKGKLKIVKGKGKISFDKFFKHAVKIDKRFNLRYTVYSDLKERGFPVRTGFKFGCDFRVYERGVKPIKKGPKKAEEHTKWVVFAVGEDYTCSFHELSRAVRLAHNIRANMLWAVVDNDNDVTYYAVTFTRL
ncbi:MAG: tRNA-intron lyase [Candidatus Hodarchaeales archaeon]|jgi:tRNA-intron endonuclease